MGSEKETISGWLLKYIIPVIVIPLITSSMISYGATRALGTQQINDAKRMDQIEKSTNINRVELSKHNSRLSKIETLIERINENLKDTTKELRMIRSNLNSIGKIVVVLKDREERDKEIK